jgi:hypothetical protein
VKVEEDTAPELKDFIDQLIVPLLVERLTRHLYSVHDSSDNTDEAIALAA